MLGDTGDDSPNAPWFQASVTTWGHYNLPAVIHTHHTELLIEFVQTWGTPQSPINSLQPHVPSQKNVICGYMWDKCQIIYCWLLLIIPIIVVPIYYLYLYFYIYISLSITVKAFSHIRLFGGSIIPMRGSRCDHFTSWSHQLGGQAVFWWF